MKKKYVPSYLEDHYEGLECGWSYGNFQDTRGLQMHILNPLMLHEMQFKLKQPRGMSDVVNFYSCYQFTKARLKITVLQTRKYICKYSTKITHFKRCHGSSVFISTQNARFLLYYSQNYAHLNRTSGSVSLNSYSTLRKSWFHTSGLYLCPDVYFPS